MEKGDNFRNIVKKNIEKKNKIDFIWTPLPRKRIDNKFLINAHSSKNFDMNFEINDLKKYFEKKNSFYFLNNEISYSNYNNISNIFSKKKKKYIQINIKTSNKYKKLQYDKSIKKTFYLNSLNSIITTNSIKENERDKKNFREYNVYNNNKKIFQCNCKNSYCLKMYCECLKNSLFCGKDCKCLNCKNNYNFLELKNEIIIKNKNKISGVFIPKYEKIYNLNDSYYNNEFQKNKIHKNGCNCKKGCKKNYCKCFSYGISCTNLCKCKHCNN